MTLHSFTMLYFLKMIRLRADIAAACRLRLHTAAYTLFDLLPHKSTTVRALYITASAPLKMVLIYSSCFCCQVESES